MLKPKKKISKQELKKDPFLEFINNAQNWVSKRKKLIYQVAIGILAVIVVVYFVGNSRKSNYNNAESLLSEALLSQDLGDSENSRFQLQNLIDEYGSTHAGIQGSYYYGKILFEEENYTEAETYLSEYVKDGTAPELLSAAYKMLADIKYENNENKKAEDLLSKGAEIAKDTVYENELALLYANQLNINGKSDKALKIVNNILEQDNILVSIKKMAEEIKGRIEG